MATVTNFDLDATTLGLNGTTTYVEGAVAKLLAPNATVTSTGDFNGQTLVISGLLAEDQIGFASGVTVTNKKPSRLAIKSSALFPAAPTARTLSSRLQATPRRLRCRRCCEI